MISLFVSNYTVAIRFNKYINEFGVSSWLESCDIAVFVLRPFIGCDDNLPTFAPSDDIVLAPESLANPVCIDGLA